MLVKDLIAKLSGCPHDLDVVLPDGMNSPICAVTIRSDVRDAAVFLDGPPRYDSIDIQQLVKLRDQIAIAALTGMLGSGEHFDGGNNGDDDAKRFAKIAYTYADAVLAARQPKPVN
jgi:hypothetical protein